MSTDYNKVNLFGKEAVDSDMFAKAIDALDYLATDQEAVELEHFKKLHPSILRAIDQGHPVSKILKTLAVAGFKIHPAKFKKLMAKLEDAGASTATPINDANDRGAQ